MFKLEINHLIFILVLGMASVNLMSCNDDDDGEPPVETQSIVDLAVADEDLSTLVQALTTADLATTLEGDGPFTVFAPTNAAFQALLDSNADWNSLDDIPGAVLTQVLLHHVLAAEVMAADLMDSYATTLSTGPNDENLSLQIDVTGGVMFNGNSSPSETDITADNGVIHKIDRVMLPPDVVGFAINNSNFSILVAALTDERHTTDFVSVLTGSGPFTVFAPTNDAFQALLDTNADWNGLADIPIETLDAVLKYHVVNRANVQSDELSNDQQIGMLSGGMATIHLDDGAKIETSSDQSINIIITDVQGTNGVIHAIDSVMLP